MGENNLETSDKFYQQTRRTRLEQKAVGVGNIYSNMQHTSAPDIDKYFIGKRMDLCLQYFLEYGGTDLLCTQGKVILIPDGTNITKKQCVKACYKAGEVVMIR